MKVKSSQNLVIDEILISHRSSQEQVIQNCWQNLSETSDLNAGMGNFFSIINESIDCFIKLKCERLKLPWYDKNVKNQVSKKSGNINVIRAIVYVQFLMP